MSFLSAVRKILSTESGGDSLTLGQDGEFLLRRFSYARDGDAICRFQRETYELNFPGFIVDQAFLIGFRHDLRRAAGDSNHGLFVIECHSQPVAFLWVVVHENSWTGERSGYVNNVYVAPSFRGRGLGKALMEQVDEHFRGHGITRVRLEVTSSNEPAVGLYLAAGYETARFVMEKDVPAPRADDGS